VFIHVAETCRCISGVAGSRSLSKVNRICLEPRPLRLLGGALPLEPSPQLSPHLCVAFLGTSSPPFWTVKLTLEFST
jgi:hypothetical protein